MAATKRGKLKEYFEGIHRNFNWITEYCSRSLEIIQDVKPELSKSIKSFHEAAKTLDKLAQDLYSRL